MGTYNDSEEFGTTWWYEIKSRYKMVYGLIVVPLKYFWSSTE